MRAAVVPALCSCVSTRFFAEDALLGIGLVVEYELATRASVKKAVNCKADDGYRLFGPAELNHKNGGVFGLGGARIPRWARVTWREGPGIEMDHKNGGWLGGSVVGDYTVPISERIPKEAIELAKSRRKAPLVLRFRIRDDGVEFGWMVRLQDGVPFQVLMYGGDLPAQLGPERG